MRRGCSCDHEWGVYTAATFPLYRVTEKVFYVNLRVRRGQAEPPVSSSGTPLSDFILREHISKPQIQRFFLSTLLNVIRGEIYMQNRDGRKRVYSLIYCLCLERHGHLEAFLYLAFHLSGITGMPIPHFLHADFVKGLAEVLARRRRSTYFLDFILQYWN